MSPRVRIERSATAAEVERLLRLLPQWFGVESALRDYVAASRTRPSYVARDPGGHAVGALVIDRHFPATAELHLLAVAPAWHRRGVGRALVETAETQLFLDGVRLLEVKTLSDTHPDENYARTRAFYTAMGFLPVEELPELWPGNPCLLMIKPLCGPGGSDFRPA